MDTRWVGIGTGMLKYWFIRRSQALANEMLQGGFGDFINYSNVDWKGEPLQLIDFDSIGEAMITFSIALRQKKLRTSLRVSPVSTRL